MKLLLAEDDERLGKLINHMLIQENNYVDWVKNGQDAYDYASLSSYDVIILDWMMPKLDGITVCKKLREDGYEGCIIMLTAKDSLEDIVSGLDTGADDYLVKPFKFEELLARIRALSRRKTKTFEQCLTAGDLSLHLDSRTVTKDDEVIDLTKKEFQLCEVLLQHKGQVLTREQLIDHIWGIDSDVSDNALDALVKLVRKKVGASLIVNIRGVGYKIGDNNV